MQFSNFSSLYFNILMIVISVFLSVKSISHLWVDLQVSCDNSQDFLLDFTTLGISSFVLFCFSFLAMLYNNAEALYYAEFHQRRPTLSFSTQTECQANQFNPILHGVQWRLGFSYRKALSHSSPQDTDSKVFNLEFSTFTRLLPQDISLYLITTRILWKTLLCFS